MVERALINDPVTGESKEIVVGLSPGQTGGYVNGEWVTRDPSSNPSSVYVEAPNIQTVRDRWGRQRVTVDGKTFYMDKNKRIEIGRYNDLKDPYRSVNREIPSWEERAQEETLRTMPRASGAATPMRRDYYPHFTPYTLRPVDSSRYPSTPIQQRTPEGYGYKTYSFYRGARNLSTSAQNKLGNWLAPVPAPRPVKSFALGFGSFFTGLPEWGASGLVGWEGVVQTKEKRQLPGMFARGLEIMGGGFVESAKREPARTAGYSVAMLLTGRAGGAKRTTGQTPILNKMFGGTPKLPASTPAFRNMFGYSKRVKAYDWTPSITTSKPALRKMFGGTPKPAPSVPVLRYMFGTSAGKRVFIKPAAPTPMKPIWTKENPYVPKPSRFGEAAYRAMRLKTPGIEQGARTYVQYNWAQAIRLPTITEIPVKTKGSVFTIGSAKRKGEFTPPTIAVLEKPKPSGSGTEIRTGTGQILILKQKTVHKTKTIQLQKQSSSYKYLSAMLVGVRVKQEPVQRLQQRVIQKAALAYKMKPIQLLRISPVQIPRMKPIQIPKQIAVQSAKQSAKQQARQAEKQITRQSQKGDFMPRIPKIPPLRFHSFESPTYDFGFKAKKKRTISKTTYTRMLQLSDLFSTKKRRK